MVGSGEHVLVVDDEPEMCDLLRKVLEKEGYHVSAPADGLQASAGLGGSRPDLVITDLLMPEGGGLDLLAEIRHRHPDLPVIIVTAFGDWHAYSRALELGAAAFISKPLKMAELVAAVHTALAHPGAGLTP